MESTVPMLSDVHSVCERLSCALPLQRAWISARERLHATGSRRQKKWPLCPRQTRPGIWNHETRSRPSSSSLGLAVCDFREVRLGCRAAGAREVVLKSKALCLRLCQRHRLPRLLLSRIADRMSSSMGTLQDEVAACVLAESGRIFSPTGHRSGISSTTLSSVSNASMRSEL